MNQARAFSPKVIFALFLVHFSGDFYSSFVNPLMPAWSQTMGLSLTQVGLLSGLTWILAFVVQPVVGYYADRKRTRLFVLGGPLLAILFIPLGGLAWGFGTLLLCLAIGSVGSSMFHPTAAAMVTSYAGEKKGVSMALFWLGGTVSFGIGPVVVTWFVAQTSLDALPILSIFGLGCLALLWVILPMPEVSPRPDSGIVSSIKDALGAAWRPIVLLWCVVVLRSFTTQSFLAFMPMLLSRQGHSLQNVGLISAIFVVSGSLSGLWAGHLADRTGYRRVFVGSFLLAAPCLFAFVHWGGMWLYVAAFAAGFSLLATYPLALTLAHELAPRGKSMVSSLMMGLAIGSGGLMVSLTGKAADLWGLQPVLGVISLIPLALIPAIWRVPEPGR